MHTLLARPVFRRLAFRVFEDLAPSLRKTRRPTGASWSKLAARACLAVVALSMLSSWSIPAAYAGDVTYAYDQQGRVVAAIDNTVQSGRNGVSYNYDLGGNLTQVAPAFVTTTALYAVSPAASPVGAQIIIYGDGFSTTPSQNTVTINGAAATVTASTISTITATVPSGASGSGPIKATSPNGMVTSTFNFTITQN